MLDLVVLDEVFGLLEVSFEFDSIVLGPVVSMGVTVVKLRVVVVEVCIRHWYE